MIVPRHKICDMCGDVVGTNLRYYIIKSKNFYCNYADGCSDNRKHHICEKCMRHICNYIKKTVDKENEKE